MQIYPAMDLLHGNVVKLESEHHRSQQKIYGTPGAVAVRWLSEGAKWLHVVDLNAALGTGMPNHTALLQLLPLAHKYKASLQWGGGVRDAASLRLLAEAELGTTGKYIDRIITGTRAVTDWPWLESAAEEYPDRLVVAIDAKGHDILVDGWQESAGLHTLDFVRQAEDVPIAAFLYTNVDVEGKGEGIDWTPIEEVIVASPKPVIISGGITTVDEVLRLKEAKAHGVVIGTALYSQVLNLEELHDQVS